MCLLCDISFTRWAFLIRLCYARERSMEVTGPGIQIWLFQFVWAASTFPSIIIYNTMHPWLGRRCHNSENIPKKWNDYSHFPSESTDGLSSGVAVFPLNLSPPPAAPFFLQLCLTLVRWPWNVLQLEQLSCNHHTLLHLNVLAKGPTESGRH